MGDPETGASYQAIKESALDAYYTFSRDRGVRMRWSQLEVVGSVSVDYEGVFETPVEQLMIQVVLLVLGGGWNHAQQFNLRRSIAAIIAANGIDQLLAQVAESELEDFSHDLKLLDLA